MISTGLTSQELSLIEELIGNYGSIVSLAQIEASLSSMSKAKLRKMVSRLAQKGWLFRVKRGVYVVCDISQRGSLAISHYTVGNLLVEDSYISFEGALQAHGMYDQLLATLRSISLTRYKDSQVGGVAYRFIKTTDKYFYGWETHWLDGWQVKIASAEKALIDMIQFHRNTYSVDLVIEVLGEYENEIDLKKLVGYLHKSTIAVQRIFGFVFDLLGLSEEAEALHSVVKGKTNSSKVTAQSDLFNARWRLYYNEFLGKYQQQPLYAQLTQHI